MGSIFFFYAPLHGQEAVRLFARYSIKQKAGDKGQLVTGEVYFDKKVRKLCYKVQYPEPSFRIIQDSTLFEFSSDTQLVRTSAIQYNPTFSIYQMLLVDPSTDLGLKKLGFRAGKVEKMDSTVIVEWLPAPKWDKKLGKVLVSSVHKRVNAVVYFTPDGQVAAGEQYNQPVWINDRWLPTQMISIVPGNNKAPDQITITSLSQLLINDTEHRFFYDFPLPVPAHSPAAH